MFGDGQREGENTEDFEQDGEERKRMYETSIWEESQMHITNCSTRRQTANI